MSKNYSNKLPLFKRLSYRQAKLVMMIALIIGFSFSFLQISLDYFNDQDKNEVILQQIFDSTKRPAAQAAYTFDSILAEEVVKGLFKYQPIYKIVLLETSQNEELAVLERNLSISSWRWLSDFLFGKSRHYTIELLVQEQKYGILQVSVDTNLLAAGFLERALVVLLSGIIRNTLLASFLLYIFHVVVTRPLFQIATTLSTIDPNNPEKTRLPCPDGHMEDELGQLVTSTNKLLASIEKRTTEQENILHDLEITKTAFSRFVPTEFLSLLNKESVVDVQLGDQVEKEMTVLFADIRDFTSLSEKMTPRENFEFINAYLGQMAPIITQHQGFIDKYIGDAIMALFPTDADNAVKGAISMLKTLAKYNQILQYTDFDTMYIGIGLHTGKLMLGMVGEQDRMDGTVMSDAVNLASRIENLTKIYGVPLLISEHTYLSLADPSQYNIRVIDATRVKGKSEIVTIYEVFDADTPTSIALKNETIADFEPGFVLYHSGEITDAKPLFETVLQVNPHDTVAQVYLERCQNFLSMTIQEEPVVLIVDDIQSNIQMLFNILNEHHFKVLVAKDGETALNIVSLDSPHLILLDVIMQGMNGFEVCQRLKNNDKTRDIPVIFMTALDKTENKIKGFELGAVDYITKPFQIKEVLSRVKNHSTLYLLRQQMQTKNAELKMQNMQLKKKIANCKSLRR